MDDNQHISEKDYNKHVKQIDELNSSINNLINSFLQFEDSKQSPNEKDILVRSDAAVEVLLQQTLFIMAATIVTFYPNDIEEAKKVVTEKLNEDLDQVLNEKIEMIQQTVNMQMQ